MKNLPSYFLVITAIFLNLGFVLLKIFNIDLHQPAWLPWLFILNGVLINIVLLYLLYREISKVREHLNIPGLNRPNRSPFQLGFSPIEEQMRNSVSDLVKADSVDNYDKLLSSIQRKLGRMEKALGVTPQPEGLSSNRSIIPPQNILTQIDQKLDQYLNQFQTQTKQHESYQADLKFLERRIEALETQPLTSSSDSCSESSLPPFTENLLQVEQPENLTLHLAQAQQEVVNVEISPSLQEIIERFNYQRPELFDDFSSISLTLTSDSSQGKVDINNRRIVQLEIPPDISQATYLKFDLDQTAWLIPNIKSRYISRIMQNLSENPEVFMITSGSSSGSLQLVKPAKLREISGGLWEIEEPGEFQG